jgi:hypothetical protein
MAKEIAPSNSGWFVASVAVLKCAAHFYWGNREQNSKLLSYTYLLIR